MNLNDISCPAAWHIRTQNGPQKQRLLVRVLDFFVIIVVNMRIPPVMTVITRTIGRSEEDSSLGDRESSYISNLINTFKNTQSLKQRIKNSNTVLLILVILSGLLFVGYLQNAHYGWSGRVLSSADSEVNNQIVNDYGVVMDCGSSGTRVFVYTWPRASSEKELLEIEPLKGILLLIFFFSNR